MKILQQNPSGITGKDHLLYILNHKYSEVDVSVAIENAENILLKSNNIAIHSITSFDNTFPEYLKSIDDPPILLFYKGDISLLEAPNRVTIVGTRSPSPHGITECKFMSKHFTDRGFVIVSGLAKGCDTIAHQTCIENGGKTIAVLPTSIDNIYPIQNRKLSKVITDTGGLLISEYHIGTIPQRRFFIERDRLQSGISQGVVVIETEIDGGTMHTANFAIQQNRVLRCIEFSLDIDIPQNRGNLELIKSGQAIGLSRSNLTKFLDSWSL